MKTQTLNPKPKPQTLNPPLWVGAPRLLSANGGPPQQALCLLWGGGVELVNSLGFGVQGLGLGFGVQGLGFRVHCLGFRVVGFRV